MKLSDTWAGKISAVSNLLKRAASLLWSDMTTGRSMQSTLTSTSVTLEPSSAESFYERSLDTHLSKPDGGL